MSRDRCWVSGVRGRRGAGTKPTPVLLLFFLFLLSGCLGEDNTPLPGLPPGVTNISNTDTVSFAPSTASIGSVVYIAWTDEGIGGDLDIFLSRSDDNGGASFSAPINVSNSTDFSGNPKIAVSGTNVYVVWEEFVSALGEREIFLRRALDQSGVLTWPFPFDTGGKNLSEFSKDCDDQLTPVPDPCPSQNAAIAVEGDNVFVAWAESTIYKIKPIPGSTATDFELVNSDILMISSSNKGDDFTFQGIPSLPNTGVVDQSPSQNPTLAADTINKRLYIAWEDFVQPGSKILFRTFNLLPNPSCLLPPCFTPLLTDPGTLLSGSIEGSNRPSLTAQGSDVFLLWEGFPSPTRNCPLLDAMGNPLPNSEIFLIQASNLPLNFIPADFTPPADPLDGNLSNSPCSSNIGRIAVSGPDIFVIWVDNTPGLGGISFRQSLNGGVTFNPTETLINTGGSLGNTAIAASGGNLFAFWEDALFGNFEIFFSRR
ncbi:MAG: hypothetical protein ACE5HN_06630 [Nitrospiria bacterium]